MDEIYRVIGIVAFWGAISAVIGALAFFIGYCAFFYLKMKWNSDLVQYYFGRTYSSDDLRRIYRLYPKMKATRLLFKYRLKNIKNASKQKA